MTFAFTNKSSVVVAWVAVAVLLISTLDHPVGVDGCLAVGQTCDPLTAPVPFGDCCTGSICRGLTDYSDLDIPENMVFYCNDYFPFSDPPEFPTLPTTTTTTTPRPCKAQGAFCAQVIDDFDPSVTSNCCTGHCKPGPHLIPICQP